MGQQLRPLTLFEIVMITLCFCGVQFGWAVQFAQATPLFLELGVPSFWVSFVWLAGPVSGLLVQPTVGVYSDNCEYKHGRRRIFIFVGMIAVIIGMLLISNARALGDWLGDPQDSHSIAITVAIIGFWILDLSNNTIQGPCRALLVDLAPPEQQALGNSSFSVMLGLGNLGGYYFGSLDLSKSMPWFGTSIRALFSLAILVLLVFTIPTLIAAKEKRFKRSEDDSKEHPISQIFTAIKTMPPALVRLCQVQFFIWIGWFTYIIYMSAWVGEQVFHGVPTAPKGSPARTKFESGVRMASLAMAANSVVTTLYSFALPRIIKTFRLKPVFAFGNITFALCMFATLMVNTETEAFVLILCCSIGWATVMVCPFAVIGEICDGQAGGLFIGVLNVFIVLPQLFVSFLMGFVIEWFGGDPVGALVIGAVSALISAVLVFRLKLREDGYERIPQ